VKSGGAKQGSCFINIKRRLKESTFHQNLDSSPIDNASSTKTNYGRTNVVENNFVESDNEYDDDDLIQTPQRGNFG